MFKNSNERKTTAIDNFYARLLFGRQLEIPSDGDIQLISKKLIFNSKSQIVSVLRYNKCLKTLSGPFWRTSVTKACLYQVQIAPN